MFRETIIVGTALLLICQDCLGCKIDFLFIFDTSDTVRKSWGQEVELVKRVIPSMSLGPGGQHRIAMIEFAGSTVLQTVIDWGEHQATGDQVIDKMKDLSYTGGKTLAARALRYALDKMIKGRRRPDADLIVSLLHDGIPQDDPVPIAKEILALPRTKIIAVGIGKLVIE